MFRIFGVGGRHKLRAKAQRRETLRREVAQPIHPRAIAGVAVNADHLAEHRQRLGHSTAQKFLQRLSLLHRPQTGQILCGGQLWQK